MSAVIPEIIREQLLTCVMLAAGGLGGLRQPLPVCHDGCVGVQPSGHVHEAHRGAAHVQHRELRLLLLHAAWPRGFGGLKLKM
jgi:hypothetical protein